MQKTPGYDEHYIILPIKTPPLSVAFSAQNKKDYVFIVLFSFAIKQLGSVLTAGFEFHLSFSQSRYSKRESLVDNFLQFKEDHQKLEHIVRNLLIVYRISVNPFLLCFLSNCVAKSIDSSNARPMGKLPMEINLSD